MSPLESRIRNLPLRPPGESIDKRITAMFSATAEATLLSASPGTPQEDDADDQRRPRPNSASSAPIRSGWIPVCASLLIGTVVGHWLPFSRLDQRSGNSIGSANVRAGEEGVSGQGTVKIHQAPEAADIVARNQEPSPERSQIVESLWISPAAAAVAWEQQTGQIFNVVNHVNDRRFDMCRDCHRVGG